MTAINLTRKPLAKVSIFCIVSGAPNTLGLAAPCHHCTDILGFMVKPVTVVKDAAIVEGISTSVAAGFEPCEEIDTDVVRLMQGLRRKFGNSEYQKGIGFVILRCYLHKRRQKCTANAHCSRSVNVRAPNNCERNDGSVAWVAVVPSDDSLVILSERVTTRNS
ncbi:hypothetical protein T265_02037 [Opisthorchis viverrini]|uniref:Uncharacterized protein n=1 Tax=Opisthorchis viverrini TaxID=6198 RepID=A0A075A0N7_OPIVI|nr:hypothetical protein T265_02037 [Opisthorchis viverrini]KER31807.1 hypothetical protein T265_02037 [Opisthorchis viverrini]